MTSKLLIASWPFSLVFGKGVTYMFEKTRAALKAKFSKKDEEEPMCEYEYDEQPETSPLLKAKIMRLVAYITPAAVAVGTYFGFAETDVTEIVTNAGLILSGILGVWFALRK